MKTAYLFMKNDHGIGRVLETIGFIDVQMVSDTKQNVLMNELTKLDPKRSILISLMDNDIIQWLIELRIVHKLTVPYLILSYLPERNVLAKFLPLTKMAKSKAKFESGTYYLGLPFLLKDLVDLIRKVTPAKISSINPVKSAYLKNETEKIISAYMHPLKKGTWTALNKKTAINFTKKPDANNYADFTKSFNSKNQWRKGEEQLETLLRNIRKIGLNLSNYPILKDLKKCFASLNKMVFPESFPKSKKEKTNVLKTIKKCFEICKTLEKLGTSYYEKD